MIGVAVSLFDADIGDPEIESINHSTATVADESIDVVAVVA